MTRTYKMILMGFMAFTSASAFSMGQGPENDPSVVSKVDYEKYSGIWFEIAHYPNSHQKDCVRSIAEYGILSPDTLEVNNICYKANNESSEVIGKATITDLSVPAKLKVSFINPPIIKSDYWIVDLDSDYKWAVVSGPNRKSLYILAREAPMERDLLNAILERLTSRGFDISKLVYDKY